MASNEKCGFFLTLLEVEGLLETCIFCHISVTDSLLFSVIMESNLRVVYSFSVRESQIIPFMIKSVLNGVR